MQMPGRNFSSDGYRYGFNGMEKDDEVKGEGNSLDFEARIYDSRLGRWLSLDPLASDYPGWTPYKGFNNNPLFFVDPDGRTEWNIHKVIDQRTGETKITITGIESNKVMTDGVHQGPGWTKGTLNPFHDKRNYYDFANVKTTIIDEEGNSTSSSEIVILKENGVKDTGVMETEKGTTMESGLDFGEMLNKSVAGREIDDLGDLNEVHVDVEIQYQTLRKEGLERKEEAITKLSIEDRKSGMGLANKIESGALGANMGGASASWINGMEIERTEGRIEELKQQKQEFQKEQKDQKP